MPAFSSTAAFSYPLTLTVGRGAQALAVHAVLASHTLFPLLGVHPALGRFFAKDDDRASAAPTVVLDHGLWKRDFGSDTTVLGRTLAIGKRFYTVIGIAPSGFTGADLSPVDVWLPAEVAGPDLIEGFASGFLNATVQIVGRLAPGASFTQAQEQATAAYLSGRSPSSAGGPHFSILIGPIQAARGPEPGRDAVMAQWLGGVSVIVLLIACLNVANVLLVRQTWRTDRAAAVLLLPYAGWTVFATALNAEIVRLNPSA